MNGQDAPCADWFWRDAMLWIAGLLGLMGIGGAALLDFGDDGSADATDETQTSGDGSGPNSSDDIPTTPADEFLDGATSGSDQGLEICDFIDMESGDSTDPDDTGDTGSSTNPEPMGRWW